MICYLVEVHLSAESCLCDGCFRYVDRKANCPASQRSRKPAARRGPLAGTVCAVHDCTQPARHSVRRKWLIKLKKSIGKKVCNYSLNICRIKLLLCQYRFNVLRC